MPSWASIVTASLSFGLILLAILASVLPFWTYTGPNDLISLRITPWRACMSVRVGAATSTQCGDTASYFEDMHNLLAAVARGAAQSGSGSSGSDSSWSGSDSSWSGSGSSNSSSGSGSESSNSSSGSGSGSSNSSSGSSSSGWSGSNSSSGSSSSGSYSSSSGSGSAPGTSSLAVRDCSHHRSIQEVSVQIARCGLTVLSMLLAAQCAVSLAGHRLSVVITGTAVFFFGGVPTAFLLVAYYVPLCGNEEFRSLGQIPGGKMGAGVYLSIVLCALAWVNGAVGCVCIKHKSLGDEDRVELAYDAVDETSPLAATYSGSVQQQHVVTVHRPTVEPTHNV